MSQKRTIGGNRLGSGNKMEVNTRTFDRSTFDMGYVWRSTLAPGTLVPFMVEPALPGDTFDIDLNAMVNTMPTVGPLFGSFKMQIDVFQCPVRLYIRSLHNNKLGIGNKMNTVKLPQLEVEVTQYDYTKNLDNQHTNPSSLLANLNIRGFGDPTTNQATGLRQFNALQLLSYWDIYKNYYANKQEEIGVMINNETQLIQTVTSIVVANGSETPITLPQNTANVIYFAGTDGYLAINHTAPAPISETIKVRIEGYDYSLPEIYDSIVTNTPTSIVATSIKPQFIGRQFAYWRYLTPTETITSEPQLKTFPLSNIDDMREQLLAQPTTSPFVIKYSTMAPYGSSLKEPSQTISPLLHSQEGLGIKTYQSDLFNNWMKTEWIDGSNGINEITAIDTSSGKFHLDTLNISKKVYDMLNHIAISGGTYEDWSEIVYDHKPFRKAETPIYHGGLIKEVIFEEVISNSQALGEDGAQPLGTLAGKGKLGSKHKGGNVTIKVDEVSYIIGIVSLTPRVDYSQGNKWDVNLKTMDDFHKPFLDEIGFQDLITEQMHHADTKFDYGNTNTWQHRSAGKQPAWLNYMTNVNIVRGNFAIEPGDATGQTGGQMFMTLNRRYEIDKNTKQIKDLTTYIDPVKYNQIFAQTSRDAQNFWVQIGVDITARRKMSSRIMPNL